MRIAYKAFNADLTCTMGKGVFQYEPGKWYEEPEANCVKNGFHCAANPLDTLDYYYNWDSNQYWLVEVEGDMDEDADPASQKTFHRGIHHARGLLHCRAPAP